jgi:hypothetical protein
MPTFEIDIRNSHKAAARAAYELSLRGYDVVLHGLHIRPTAAQRFYYTDGGDLSVKYDGGWRTVEVKWRDSVNFTSRYDYPHEFVFVDTVESHDKKNPPPLMYVIFNPPLTACILVDEKTRQLWRRTSRRIANRAGGTYEVNFYACPLTACRWERL